MPVQGALFDQPLTLMVEMETLKNVHDAYHSYENRGKLKVHEWAERYPGLEEIYLNVEEMRLEDG